MPQYKTRIIGGKTIVLDGSRARTAWERILPYVRDEAGADTTKSHKPKKRNSRDLDKLVQREILKMDKSTELGQDTRDLESQSIYGSPIDRSLPGDDDEDFLTKLYG